MIPVPCLGERENDRADTKATRRKEQSTPLTEMDDCGQVDPNDRVGTEEEKKKKKSDLIVRIGADGYGTKQEEDPGVVADPIGNGKGNGRETSTGNGRGDEKEDLRASEH
jgi:hypothetical protein